jgi:gamma-butyrobetaine dioxygenase
VLKLRIEPPSLVAIEREGAPPTPIHPLWLRERCSDPASMDPRTGQRLQDPSDFSLDLAMVDVQETAPGRLRVRFSDGHVSEFDATEILAEASMAPGDQGTPPPTLWNSALAPLPRARWRTDPPAAEFADWVERFLRFGFIIFSGIPAVPNQVLEVGGIFGITRETNFGALFDVRTTPQASDLAYTSVHLDAHTDNPYRTPVPGVQLLHCLVNETSGGLSTLVDGYAVAEALRERDPAAYRILSETPVRFRYRDADTELVASVAPIELDVAGRVRTIHFSPRLDFVPLLPPAVLAEYYRARQAFDRMLRSAEFEIRFLLAPGDLVMFDNCRLLHGRTGFNSTEGLRHLQGCYIDIDGPRSLYRVHRRSARAV